MSSSTGGLPLELPQVEFKFIEEPSLKKIFSDSPSLPFGYNKNAIKVNSKDISSIIAFGLSSNLYLEGLIKINYMELATKIGAYIGP